jgi:translation initiation factor 2 beta subunit (eIF-2beta)/eIF-5
MKHLTNDMDELFQRAGSDYPLRKSESEWDSIAARLKNDGVSKKGKRRRAKYTGLGLLFLVTGMLPSLLTQLTNNKSGGFSRQEHPGVPTTITENNLRSVRNPENHIAQNIQRRIVPGHPVIFFPKEIVTPDHSSEAEIMVRSGRIINTPIKQELQLVNSFVNDTADTGIKEQEIPVMQRADNKIIASTEKNKKKYGFYAGFIAGPQISEVKGQGMRKAGIDIGITGGYRFIRNLSAETGVIFSRKYYFSSGRHFHMPKEDPAMPPDMKVLSIEGSSHVFEIPVKLKYDILQKGKASLFSSVCISSYIMTKEKNNYQLIMNGNPGQMTGNYKSTNRYMAAAFTISAGYEHKTGKRSIIRLEPYIQIPIKGIGVGSMPVTSAGLHIGIIWNNK